MLDAAHAYNEALAANGDRWHLTDEQRQTYENTLDITGTGLRVRDHTAHKVKLPVYLAPAKACCKSRQGIWRERHCP